MLYNSLRIAAIIEYRDFRQGASVLEAFVEYETLGNLQQYIERTGLNFLAQKKNSNHRRPNTGHTCICPAAVYHAPRHEALGVGIAHLQSKSRDER